MLCRVGGRARLRVVAVFVVFLWVCLPLLVTGEGVTAVPAGPPYGSNEWVRRELENWGRSFERYREQRATPGFLDRAVPAERNRLRAFWASEDATQFRGRPRMTFTRWTTTLFMGDPWRNELNWEAAGGAHTRVYLLNRWGAKLTGDLWGPPGMAHTEATYPLVVITTGSIQGSARMYWWAAQTLAAHGYVVLTYDVQGQGESETFARHADGSIRCDGADQPPGTPYFITELTDCPGFPFQQSANFGIGAIDSFNFAVSTPDSPYAPWQDGTGTAPYNPWYEHIDRTRTGIAGHSLGAAAVSFVQAHPEYLNADLSAIVAWDSLSACSEHADKGPPPLSGECLERGVNTPRVPALDLSADYFLSFLPDLGRPPDPKERHAAFDLWREHGQDVLAISLRGSTHLEFTSVPGVTPFLSGTKYGQDVSAYYTLAFFDTYVKGDTAAAARLVDRTVEVTHLDPIGAPDPSPTVLDIADLSSLYHDSAVSVAGLCFTDWGEQADAC